MAGGGAGRGCVTSGTHVVHTRCADEDNKLAKRKYERERKSERARETKQNRVEEGKG